MKFYAIIVGGGTGSRMQSDLPKQFMLLQGRPVLMHTIEAFYNSEIKPEIILVLNVDFHSYWEELCIKYNFQIPCQLVKAGSNRFYSVKNGLKAIKGRAIVAIHDAVRPLVSARLIKDTFEQSMNFGTAVAALKSQDSVRQLNGESTVHLNREDIYLIQTPQVFKSNILIKAYKQDYRNEFTDDASVVERSGVNIHLVEGENRNLKITFPEDIHLAEYFLGISQK